MLPDGARNEGYSLDDAFDELLRWASTDDADRGGLDLLGLAGGLDEPHWRSGEVSAILGRPRCRCAGQGRARRLFDVAFDDVRGVRRGRALRLRVTMESAVSRGVRGNKRQ